MHKMIKEAEIGSIVKVPLTLIKPNPDQPRKFFDQLSIESLGQSCAKKDDVEQPILVVKCDDEKSVMIVDGERRWRAAKHAGIESVSCFIKPPMSSIDIFVTSAITNFGRENMSPIEEAFALKRIMDEKKMNQSELSALVGKHPAQISNILKYLKLDREIQAMVVTKKFDKGAALQLASYKKDDQVSLLKALKQEIAQRGGNKIHPNEASRFLRGEAEKRGLGHAPRGRGRELKSHADLTTRNISNNIKSMQKSLNEFEKLSVEAIKDLSGGHFLDIMQDLKGLCQKIENQIARLEKMD